MGEKAEPNNEVDKAKSVLATKTLKFDKKIKNKNLNFYSIRISQEDFLF